MSQLYITVYVMFPIRNEPLSGSFEMFVYVCKCVWDVYVTHIGVKLREVFFFYKEQISIFLYYCTLCHYQIKKQQHRDSGFNDSSSEKKHSESSCFKSCLSKFGQHKILQHINENKQPFIYSGNLSLSLHQLMPVTNNIITAVNTSKPGSSSSWSTTHKPKPEYSYVGWWGRIMAKSWYDSCDRASQTRPEL